jgi:hypothetical protein
MSRSKTNSGADARTLIEDWGYVALSLFLGSCHIRLLDQFAFKQIIIALGAGLSSYGLARICREFIEIFKDCWIEIHA